MKKILSKLSIMLVVVLFLTACGTKPYKTINNEDHGYNSKLELYGSSENITRIVLTSITKEDITESEFKSAESIFNNQLKDSKSVKFSIKRQGNKGVFSFDADLSKKETINFLKNTRLLSREFDDTKQVKESDLNLR